MKNIEDSNGSEWKTKHNIDSPDRSEYNVLKYESYV